MIEFQAYINKKKGEEDPLEKLLFDLEGTFKNNALKVEVNDFNDPAVRKKAEKLGVEEVPSLLFNRIRISGQMNEYFLLAVIAQLLTTDGNDQKLSKFTMTDQDNTIKIHTASELLFFQSQMREDTQSYLLLIRENPDTIHIKKLKKAAERGSMIFILTNFKLGKNFAKVAALGELDNVLLGHIDRDNMHMTISITIRKNRPFLGSFLRGKEVDDVWKGQWSPLLHDTVTELKKFYIPLFQTATPVHLDGTLPDPPETNRVIAKVKDALEQLKALF